jgi:hypothetical protein
MYAARGEIQSRTGKSLDDQYFCQTLLPDYMNAHPQETACWDVVFDARGHFTEPHTQVIVPLGTLEVRAYLSGISHHAVHSLGVTVKERLFPTRGPKSRFGAVLFIEKEGFMPLFKAVRLAERYDLAIMSTKGLSVTASRLLVDQLCVKCAGLSIPLLILHDFDKSGFSIIGTLKRDTRRYTFRNEIEAIDLGLRLVDVQAWGLESEEVRYRKGNPESNLRTNGATEEEVKFLCSDRNQSGGYQGRRVELNAFTSGDLIEFIEAKLARHGIHKLMPDHDTMETAYRRALQVKILNQSFGPLVKQAQEEAAKSSVPESLEEQVRKRLEENPALPWDQVITEMVASETMPVGDR